MSDMEKLATNLFLVAIRDGQAWELMVCLSEGGSATVDLHADKLVMINSETLRQMLAP